MRPNRSTTSASVIACRGLLKGDNPAPTKDALIETLRLRRAWPARGTSTSLAARAGRIAAARTVIGIGVLRFTGRTRSAFLPARFRLFHGAWLEQALHPAFLLP